MLAALVSTSVILKQRKTSFSFIISMPREETLMAFNSSSMSVVLAVDKAIILLSMGKTPYFICVY
ncbi:hypothetical protein D081_0942 [Anaerovibrio sp. JC8]|nr:hypothetical protein D081_0942 [Anaerovibrio sp. JC8]